MPGGCVSLDWLEDAACADLPPDAASTRPGGVYDPAIVEACERCPVRDECLRHTLRWGITAQHGYRGGLPAAQRRALKRQQR